MLRQGVSRPLLRANQLVARRTFSRAIVRMGEGDTGAPRPGKDQFTQREAAQETIYIREKEMEKLKAFRVKLKEQRHHLDEVDKDLEQLTGEQGGEKSP
ncbi:Mitochondrial ATPase inhibitor, IATP domain containing protein [Elaphomyces granulatus]